LKIGGCQYFASIKTVGSGADRTVRPADIFVQSDAYGNLFIPPTGFALAALTEPLTTTPNNSITYREPKGGAAPQLVNAERGVYPSTGLSAKEQRNFYRLRVAIQDTYRRGDGGASLWPLYIDMFRNAVKDGKLGGRSGAMQM